MFCWKWPVGRRFSVWLLKKTGEHISASNGMTDILIVCLIHSVYVVLQEVCCGVEEIQCPPLVVSVMPSLPRGAAVELHVIAVQDEPAERTSCQMSSEIPGGTVHWQVLQSSNRHYATLSLTVSLHESCTTPECMGTECILVAVCTSFQQALKNMEETLSPLCTRVFYKDSNKLAAELSAGKRTHSIFKSQFLMRNIQPN